MKTFNILKLAILVFFILSLGGCAEPGYVVPDYVGAMRAQDDISWISQAHYAIGYRTDTLSDVVGLELKNACLRGVHVTVITGIQGSRAIEGLHNSCVRTIVSEFYGDASGSVVIIDERTLLVRGVYVPNQHHELEQEARFQNVLLYRTGPRHLDSQHPF